MKKYFPIILFIFAFSGYLFYQVAIERSEVTAGIVQTKNKEQRYFENLFDSTKFVTTSGEIFDLSSLKTPIVIINFWASWCTNCLSEIPTLVDLRKKIDKNKITILTINTDTKDIEKNIKKIVSKYNMDYPVVSDSDGSISHDFNITALPTTIVFKKGKGPEVYTGATDFISEEFLSGISL